MSPFVGLGKHVHVGRAECSYVVAVGSETDVPARREIVLTEEFRQALALLAAGRHLFLTGNAGTGKSTLIRRFMAETDRNDRTLPRDRGAREPLRKCCQSMYYVFAMQRC
jgi:MoxR-like ATPase